MTRGFKRIFSVFRFAVLLLTGIMLYLVFIPKHYDTPVFHAREGTEYWQLPTGSHIGYTRISAKGSRNPCPVIFLQGGPGGPIYDSNIKLLSGLSADGYDVYLYDQVGCGASSRLDNIEEYTVDRHKRDLEEIVNAINAEKVILIGQSWGAILACAYMADNRAKVEKVIFTGPGPMLPWNKNLEKINAPDSLQLKPPVFTNRQGRKEIYNLRARFVEFCANTFDVKLASDKEMDAFSTLLNHRMGRSTVCNPEALARVDRIESGSGYYSMVKTARSFQSVTDIRTKLTACPVPALIMRGRCDGIPWGYTTDYLQQFTNHRLVIIPDAGHSIGREQPEVYIETIREFINSN